MNLIKFPTKRNTNTLTRLRFLNISMFLSRKINKGDLHVDIHTLCLELYMKEIG